MVGPAAKRAGVAHLKAVMGLSERRACLIIGADRKMVRYRSCRPPDTELRGRLRELANERRVKTIKEQVVRVVESEFPHTTLAVITAPRALDSETILERIMLTAAKRRLPVHHVTVQDIEDRTSIGLDIEVDGRMSLSGAHNLASKFEAAGTNWERKSRLRRISSPERSHIWQVRRPHPLSFPKSQAKSNSLPLKSARSWISTTFVFEKPLRGSS
jgi:hypothetical protein